MRFRDLLLIVIAVFTVTDMGMRLDQRMLCQRDDRVRCPTEISVWQRLPAFILR